jgi:hypothetical protein
VVEKMPVVNSKASEKNTGRIFISYSSKIKIKQIFLLS